jgi:hypothetical protein
MAEPTLEELIVRYEQVCARIPRVFDLIADAPSAAALQLGIETLLDLHLCESALYEVERSQLQDRLKRIEDSLGLTPWPPASGGTVRPSRRQ